MRKKNKERFVYFHLASRHQIQRSLELTWREEYQRIYTYLIVCHMMRPFKVEKKEFQIGSIIISSIY